MPASDKNTGNEWESAASIQQLELELAIVLEEAREDLYAADVVGIFEGMRAGLSGLPDWEQLRLAGTALLQLAEVCELRADRLCRDWEEGHNQAGPVLNDEVLEGLVQKTTHIDISALIAGPLPRGRKQSGKRQPTDSVVGEVNKTILLQVVDSIADEAAEKERALQVAHDENVSAWVETIVALSRDTCKNLSYGYQSLAVTILQLCQLVTKLHSPMVVESTANPQYNRQNVSVVESDKD